MFTVAALYRFASFPDPAALRDPLLALCLDLGIKGSLLLAKEGINGTIAGEASAVAQLVSHIRSMAGCAELDVKYSRADTMPFYRTKVLIKKEIVTLGQPGVDPVGNAGVYVPPEEWNELISDPETLVIDTRNDYEVSIGSFAGAKNPQTTTFREFPDWFRKHRDDIIAGKRRVAMFCTGGIRCEKSTAFLRAEGVEEVYHLQGGILRYLETIPPEQSLWQGECFVFDQRVSVGHGLSPGTHGRCHACRDPLSPEEMAGPLYVEGVSCPHCHDRYDESRRQRFAERQKQVELARQRGQDHIGVDPRKL